MVKKRTSLLNTMLRAGMNVGIQANKQQRTAARMLGALMAPPAKPRAKKPAAAKPARPPLPGQWLSLNFASLTTRMRYWLYLPSTLPASAHVGLPLVVMLHGCEQTATSFADGSRMNRAAEKAGYAVLYPQQSVASHPHRCWKWYDRATQQGGGDAATIAALVKAVVLAWPIDPARIYIAGISAGAAMAHIVALNHPGLFAGLGMHSGPAFGAGHSAVGALGVMQHGAGGRTEEAIAEVLLRQSAQAHLPTIVIHGDEDAVVRPVNQLQVAQQALHLNGLTGGVEKVTDKPATSRTLAHRIRDVCRGRKPMLRMVSITGLKHAWSGGDARFKFNSAAGPDASKLMLEFFSKH